MKLFTFIEDYLHNINEKYRVQNENTRKTIRDSILHDIAFQVAVDLGQIFCGQTFPLCAPIKGPDSFETKRISVDSTYHCTKILFGIQKSYLERNGVPEVLDKIVSMMNSRINTNVRYGIGRATGKDFAFLYPALSAGVIVKGAREVAAEILIVVWVNVYPSYPGIKF
ncbi:MAG: hypothetical protein K5768_08465 [Firmicutes bacterium]|nr:hypothetical protein [Bacillota bacterium]